MLAGRVTLTCLLLTYSQLVDGRTCDGESHVIPFGVAHVSRTLNVTSDLSRFAAGYGRGNDVGLVVLSKTTSSRLIPVIDVPSALRATGKLAPSRPPVAAVPDWLMSPCQPLQTSV